MNRLQSRLTFSALFAFVFLLPACGRPTQPIVPFSPQNFQRAEPLGEAANVDVKSYKVGDGGANAQGILGLNLGADGNLYYSAGPIPIGTPYPLSGEIGSFNVSTHTQTFATVSYWPGFLEETAHGVWVEELNNTSGQVTVDHYSAIGGTDTAVALPIGPFSGGFGNGISGGIAVGADGQLWWGSNQSPQVGEINQTTNAVKVYTLGTPSGGIPPAPQFMVSASDKNIWVTDADNDAVFRVVGTGVNKGTSTYTVMPQGLTYNPILEGITEGSDKKLYTGSEYLAASSNGYFNAAPISATPAFTSLPLPSIGSFPYIFAPVKGKIYFNDFIWEGLGIYETATKALTILPLRNPTGASGSGGIAADNSGRVWIGCTIVTKSGTGACLETVSLTSTWQVFPSTSIKLYTQNPYGVSLPPGLIGIGETGHSGPFTVKSSDTSICTASVISGFDHNVQVNPVKAGTCTLTITDAHSRSVNVAVKIISGKGSPDNRVGPPGRRGPAVSSGSD